MKKAVLQPKNRDHLSMILLITIFLLAFVLRFYCLGCRPLYGDEPFSTVEVADKPLSYILTTNFGSNLYPLLLHYLLPLGDTEVMSRLPAAVFGFLSVWGVFLVGKRILGRKEALIAAFLAATSTPFIYFSQQSRGYSGFLFFSLIALYFFWRAVQEERVSLWIFYGLFMVIGTYTIFFLLVALPLQALFVLLLRAKKKIAKKTLLYFLISAFSIAGLALLLYWPTRHTEVHTSVNFFYLLKNSLQSLFRIERNMNLFSFISETFQRQLDYASWIPYFFVKLFLFLLGCVFCLKSQKKEVFLFLSYIILPFIFFVLSNPPGIYGSSQDNKFLLILPVLYLLMAKGLTGLSAAAAKAFNASGGVKSSGAIENIVLGVLILGIALGEGVSLHNYNFFIWNLQSPKRDRGVDAFIMQHREGLEVILPEDLPNKAGALFVKSLDSSIKSPKSIMIYEGVIEQFPAYQAQKLGLWVILRRTSKGEENLYQLLAPFREIEVHTFRRSILLHFRGAESSILDKMSVAAKWLLNISPEKEKKIEYYLLSAKLHLLADRIPEGLEEIESAERLRTQSFPIVKEHAGKSLASLWNEYLFIPKKMTRHDIVRGDLALQIADLLIGMAGHSLSRGQLEEALLLQSTARRIHPLYCDSVHWFHEVSAACYFQEGKRAEALREYKKALMTCPDEGSVISVLRHMRETLALPCGLVLWQQKNIYEVRWWGVQKTTFAGILESSSPIKKVRGVDLTSHDRYHQRDAKTLRFMGVVKEGRIEGLTITTERNFRPALSLMINGKKDTGERVILLFDNVSTPELSSKSHDDFPMEFLLPLMLERYRRPWSFFNDFAFSLLCAKLEFD